MKAIKMDPGVIQDPAKTVELFFRNLILTGRSTKINPKWVSSKISWNERLLSSVCEEFLEFLNASRGVVPAVLVDEFHLLRVV